MANKPTGLKSPFADAILKKGSPIQYPAPRPQGSSERVAK